MSDTCYRLEVPAFGLVFELDRLRREHNELIGELTVRCTLPAVPTVKNSIVHRADFNVSSLRARTERQKVLKQKIPNAEIDWGFQLEALCLETLQFERRGIGAVDLRTLPEPEAEDSLMIAPFSFPRRSPTILFGDGGSGKSYLALYVAGKLCQQGFRVGYFDWECEAVDHRRRLQRLFADKMPQIFYCECERPLHYECDRLRHIAKEHQLDYGFYDSVAFACDGPPEAAEVAGRYFRALRTIGIGSFHIAHVNKSENHDQKPFGSIFWHNGARSTWFVKAVNEDREDGKLSLGFYNRKANSGPLARPIGLTLSFMTGVTSFSLSHLTDHAELSGKMWASDKLAEHLKHGAKHYAELSHLTDEKINTLVQAVRRNPRRFVQLPDGRVGLATTVKDETSAI